MILKALRRNKLVTVNYYMDGAIQTLKGRVHNLDLSDQTLSLEDENKNIFSIRLAGIKEIY
ncbi:YolD-like family protein [Metabacillus idriensis]|uniref:YolD-like family protein n=1 Tax=Metabacillus idriensis TaxID=324768 RepID=UPI00281320D6|nr:YolD-like family protein [Metabacillus idriensis]MDR0136665.1 YolD-like family protein [Metabacillus idriensis]